MGGVVQDHAEIFQVETVAQRRFHADIGGDAAKHERADAARAQDAVELAIEEAAVAGLRNDDVAGLRWQFVDQRIVPAAFCQKRAVQLGRACAWSSVHSTCASSASRGRRPRHSPCPSHSGNRSRGRRGPRRRPAPPSSRDRCSGAGDVEACDVEIAPLRGVGVLHIDDDDRRLVYEAVAARGVPAR